MKIGIIGAGYTGLAAAWDLTKAGHEVTILEQAEKAGGLAGGFNQSNWDWSLDEHYHHLFATDNDMGDWLKELDLGNAIRLYDVKTKSLINDKKYRLDSPLSLLKLPMLGLIDKLRVGAVLAFFKVLPNGIWLEKFGAVKFLKLTMGDKAYRILWQDLMEGKFGQLANEVNLAWFWSRIKARTKLLAYPNGGFDALTKKVVEKLKKAGVKIELSSFVSKINKKGELWQVEYQQKGKTKQLQLDQVLVTGTDKVLSYLVPDLPSVYLSKISRLKMLGAVTLVLELDKLFFDDGTYWLSISQPGLPFLAVVEHTNLTGRTQYGGKSLVYVGNYLSQDDELMLFSADKLLEKYQPELNKLSPSFMSHIKNKWVFSSKFAQPVVGLNHSQILPCMKTPLTGLYWSSMQHVYPWDRGTNYAVKAGRQVASQMMRQRA